MDVFVYGTLTDPSQAGAVLDEFAYVGAATLSGLHRVEGRYPTLAPSGRVAGRLLRTDDVDALDRYESVETGLYVRVSVPLDGAVDSAGSEAAVYVGDPDRLDAPADWPGEGDFGARVRRYVREQAVRLTLD
jgi:gamma-glutamylcyclotransferase (GGCT)/AIG2-like uncharacterized protein YtfP